MRARSVNILMTIALVKAGIGGERRFCAVLGEEEDTGLLWKPQCFLVTEANYFLIVTPSSFFRRHLPAASKLTAANHEDDCLSFLVEVLSLGLKFKPPWLSEWM